jgi:hypothetical protein
MRNNLNIGSTPQEIAKSAELKELKKRLTASTNIWKLGKDQKN